MRPKLFKSIETSNNFYKSIQVNSLSIQMSFSASVTGRYPLFYPKGHRGKREKKRGHTGATKLFRGMEAGTNFYKDIHVKDSRREGWVALVAKQRRERTAGRDPCDVDGIC